MLGSNQRQSPLKGGALFFRPIGTAELEQTYELFRAIFRAKLL
ncbi:hypothetical protein SynRS9915_02782 [Synechococcus sp. RS9915]|nr:hypothetical protein SynRS9915_02782 [Synechococcus sp. RS9915]